MRALRMCILSRRRVDAGLLDAVLDAKRDALRSDGLLETVRRDASFADVAGLRHLRDWIAKRKSALTPEGRRFGLEPPKGILITGVQGCGKSLAARSVAGEWATRWRGSMPARYTTNSSVKVRRNYRKRWSWRRN